MLTNSRPAIPATEFKGTGVDAKWIVYGNFLRRPEVLDPSTHRQPRCKDNVPSRCPTMFHTNGGSGRVGKLDVRLSPEHDSWADPILRSALSHSGSGERRRRDREHGDRTARVDVRLPTVRTQQDARRGVCLIAREQRFCWAVERIRTQHSNVRMSKIIRLPACVGPPRAAQRARSLVTSSHSDLCPTRNRPDRLLLTRFDRLLRSVAAIDRRCNGTQVMRSGGGKQQHMRSARSCSESQVRGPIFNGVMEPFVRAEYQSVTSPCKAIRRRSSVCSDSRRCHSAVGKGLRFCCQGFGGFLFSCRTGGLRRSGGGGICSVSSLGIPGRFVSVKAS